MTEQLSVVETPHRIGGGRWLLVDVDTDTVIDLHGDAVLVERVREAERWAAGGLSGATTDSVVGVRIELHAKSVGGVWYSAWAPREELSEAIGVLVAEVDS